MAMLLNLNKPLVSRIEVDGRVQRVEYEALPNVCFACGHYGYMKESCIVAIDQDKQWVDGVNSPTKAQPCV